MLPRVSMALPDGRKTAVNNETDSDGGAKRQRTTEVGTGTRRGPFISAPVEHLWQRNIPDDAAMAGKRPDSWWTIGRSLSECPGWQRSEDRLSSLQMPVRLMRRAGWLRSEGSETWLLLRRTSAPVPAPSCKRTSRTAGR